MSPAPKVWTWRRRPGHRGGAPRRWTARGRTGAAVTRAVDGRSGRRRCAWAVRELWPTSRAITKIRPMPAMPASSRLSGPPLAMRPTPCRSRAVAPPALAPRLPSQRPLTRPIRVDSGTCSRATARLCRPSGARRPLRERLLGAAVALGIGRGGERVPPRGVGTARAVARLRGGGATGAGCWRLGAPARTGAAPAVSAARSAGGPRPPPRPPTVGAAEVGRRGGAAAATISDAEAGRAPAEGTWTPRRGGAPLTIWTESSSASAPRASARRTLTASRIRAHSARGPGAGGETRRRGAVRGGAGRQPGPVAAAAAQGEAAWARLHAVAARRIGVCRRGQVRLPRLGDTATTSGHSSSAATRRRGARQNGRARARDPARARTAGDRSAAAGSTTAAPTARPPAADPGWLGAGWPARRSSPPPGEPAAGRVDEGSTAGPALLVPPCQGRCSSGGDGRWRRHRGRVGGRVDGDAHLLEHQLRGRRVDAHPCELADPRLLLAKGGGAGAASGAADEVRVDLGAPLRCQLVVDEGAEREQAALHSAISL